MMEGSNVTKYLLVFVSFLWVFGEGLQAQQLVLPKMFSDNMVVQRDESSNIWGWGPVAGQVQIKVSWSAETSSATINANGFWQLKLPAGEAGGPHTIDITVGNTKVSIENVLLGDVWLCAGQSNMAMNAKGGAVGVMESLNIEQDKGIRLLHVNRTASEYPQHQMGNSWTTVSRSTLASFSAVGFFIAKAIRKELNVPIGIISANWGNTPAEVWTPQEQLRKDSTIWNNAITIAPTKGRTNIAAGLWNAMIYPLVPFSMKGVFWYQGESNIQTWKQYNKLIKLMVTGWRDAWQRELPFYFVQIAPYDYKSKSELAPYLREEQSKTALELSKSAMVVTTDLVKDVMQIHPPEKIEVANRLVSIAMHEVYGMKKFADYKSPIFKSALIKGDKVEISFHYLEGNLVCRGKQVTNLQVAGVDRIFYPASARIKENRLIVWSEYIKAPVAVRFGFSEVAQPNLFNKNGLPVSPFRTDNWNVDEL